MTLSTSQPIVSQSTLAYLQNPALAVGNLQIQLQLDQPIRDSRSPQHKLALEMLNLCGLMELVLEKETMLGQSGQDMGLIGKALDNLAHKLDGLLEKAEHLCGQHVEGYLQQCPGWQAMFPRVWTHVGLQQVAATSSSSHYSHTQHLNTILSTSMVLRHSLLDPRISHRYLAHQLALTYQSLSAAPELQKRYNSEIQSRFDNIKAQCSAGGNDDAMIRLDDAQGSWMYTMATDLATQIGLQQREDGSSIGLKSLYEQGGQESRYLTDAVSNIQ